MKSAPILLGVALCSCAAPALRAQEQDTLSEALARLQSAAPADYESAIDAVLELEPTLEQLRAMVSKDGGIAPLAGELEAGWSAHEATDEQGNTRPYQLYVPESVAAGQVPTALIVHMHGSVGREDFGEGVGSPQAVGYAGFLWPELAEDASLVILSPAGRADCSWWTQAGVDHVRASIRDTRRHVLVPDRQIFATGFSDGASGAFYQAMAAPDPFAGFIAMNGHPQVASSASGKQLYPQNMAATPGVVAMTQEDSLYPSRTVLPHITTAISEGANLLTLSYPAMNHQPSYFEEQVGTFLRFLTETERTDQAETLRWFTADAASSPGVKWLEVLELGEGEDDARELPDVNVTQAPGRLRLGVQVREQSGSPIIASVTDNSIASAMGLEEGDTFVSFLDKPIANTGALRAVLGTIQYGDSIHIEVVRGDETKRLDFTTPPFPTNKQVYRRNNPTAYVTVRRPPNPGEGALDLTARNARRVRVWLPDSYRDTQKLTATINDKVQSLVIHTLPMRDVLTRLARSGDMNATSGAFVEITP